MHLGQINMQAELNAAKRQQQMELLGRLEKQYNSNLDILRKFQSTTPPIREKARVMESQTDLNMEFLQKQQYYRSQKMQAETIESTLPNLKMAIIKKKMQIQQDFAAPVEALPAPAPKAAFPSALNTDNVGAEADAEANLRMQQLKEQQAELNQLNANKLRQESERRKSWAMEASRVIKQPTKTRPFRSSQPFAKPKAQVRKVEVLPAVVDKKMNLLPVALGAGVLLLFMGK